MKPQVSHLLTAAPSMPGPDGKRIGNQEWSQTRTIGSDGYSEGVSGKPEDTGFLEEVTFELFSKWIRERSIPGRKEAGRRDRGQRVGAMSRDPQGG